LFNVFVPSSYTNADMPTSHHEQVGLRHRGGRMVNSCSPPQPIRRLRVRAS